MLYPWTDNGECWGGGEERETTRFPVYNTPPSCFACHTALKSSKVVNKASANYMLHGNVINVLETSGWLFSLSLPCPALHLPWTRTCSKHIVSVVIDSIHYHIKPEKQREGNLFSTLFESPPPLVPQWPSQVTMTCFNISHHHYHLIVRPLCEPLGCYAVSLQCRCSDFLGQLSARQLTAASPRQWSLLLFAVRGNLAVEQPTSFKVRTPYQDVP